MGKDSVLRVTDELMLRLYITLLAVQHDVSPFLLNNALTEYSVTLLGLIMAMIIY